VYQAGKRFANTVLSQTTREGYAFWARPLSEILDKKPWLYRVFRPLIQRYAQHIAYHMGAVKEDSLSGQMIFSVFRPLCYLVGSAVTAARSLRPAVTTTSALQAS